MDQPAGEVLRLEKILDAFSRYDEHQSKKRDTRSKNRARHDEVKVGP